MARSTQTARPKHLAPVPSPTTKPSTTSPQPHADFIEVTVHTAKCDSCTEHNKLTLYRCMECGQHVCSSCWTKPGDRTHVFGGGGGSRNEPPGLNPIINVIEHGHGGGGKGHEDARRTRARRRRVRVISDDEDDNFPAVLKPASTTTTTTTTNAELTVASDQHQKSNNDVIMDDDHHHDHGDDLPGLWPIIPGNGPQPVLRPGVLTANTSAATESAGRVMQRNPHIHPEELASERQRTVQVFENVGMQTFPNQHALVGDHETSLQARRPSKPSVSIQQAIHTAPSHYQPAVYRARPGVDVDRQAARYQPPFANNELTNRQAPRSAQPSVVHQQTPHYLQPAIYRPRPGTNVDQQAARNQLAFAPCQYTSHQARPPSQASISHQQAILPTPRPAQTSASVSQRYVQSAATLDQMMARNQQAQAYVRAKQMEARNRQALSSRQNASPAVDRDQVLAHNQQAFISNRRSFAAAADYEQMLRARDQQQNYLERQQTNRPSSGLARVSVSHGGTPDLDRSPVQASLTQQHAALRASRHAQRQVPTQDRVNRYSTGIQLGEHSPEAIEAADNLLYYAGVDKKPGDRFTSEQDASGFSNPLSAAGRPEVPGSASTDSGISSPALVGGSKTVNIQVTSPRGSACNPTPSDTDADSAKIRFQKDQARPAGMHSSSGSREDVSHLPAQSQGHQNRRHAALQPRSGPALADASPAQSHESSSRDAQSHPGSRLPMSEHAATYINQWNSGSAAPSSSSRSPVVDAPAPQLNRPRSAFRARQSHSIISVKYMTANGIEPGEAAEAGTQALRTPISTRRESNGVDIVMGAPEVEILEEDDSRRSEARTPDKHLWTVGKDRDTEKHPRGEKEGGQKSSKEHKASGDADVVAARERSSKEEPTEQIDDDDANDVEITSWNNKVDSNKTTESHHGATAKANGHKSGKSIKKGVAYVKKPEPKGRKGKTTKIRVE